MFFSLPWSRSSISCDGQPTTPKTTISSFVYLEPSRSRLFLSHFRLSYYIIRTTKGNKRADKNEYGAIYAYAPCSAALRLRTPHSPKKTTRTLFEFWCQRLSLFASHSFSISHSLKKLSNFSLSARKNLSIAFSLFPPLISVKKAVCFPQKWAEKARKALACLLRNAILCTPSPTQ